jgi:CheY-like chemotaxis protein
MTTNAPLLCLIEDDQFQVFLLQKMLELSKFDCEILVFNDGKTAYEGLSKRHFEGLPQPDLVFLDINMPIWDGWEFLTEMRANRIPVGEKVFVLSSSMCPEDTLLSSKFGLENSFISKPLSKNQLYEMISTIAEKTKLTPD